MPKPNTQFELSVNDIELIEKALRTVDQTEEIVQLLGKLHQQKNWYRPKGLYISG